MMADDGHEFTLGDVGQVAHCYEKAIDRRAAAFHGVGIAMELQGVDAGFLAAVQIPHIPSPHPAPPDAPASGPSEVASFLREFGESQGACRLCQRCAEHRKRRVEAYEAAGGALVDADPVKVRHGMLLTAHALTGHGMSCADRGDYREAKNRCHLDLAILAVGWASSRLMLCIV